MTFENMVARVRKIGEHIKEMLDIVESLKCERECLEAKILEQLDAQPGLYNVYVHKNESAGLVGRSLFKVAYSTSLARLGAKDRLDDQEWLESIWKHDVGVHYQMSKRILLAGKIAADYKAGKLDDAALRSMRLRYVRKASLTVGRIPDETELNALKRSAEELADGAA